MVLLLLICIPFIALSAWWLRLSAGRPSPDTAGPWPTPAGASRLSAQGEVIVIGRLSRRTLGLDYLLVDRLRTGFGNPVFSQVQIPSGLLPCHP